MAARTIPLFIVASLLGGCGLADAFGDRALEYNVQAEKARNKALLANIVRAALRRPMQFSDVSTVSGTASATGGIGTALPLLGQAFANPRLYQINPTAMVSGGPTFTVGTLNTKEFYSGIMTPVSAQIMDYYVQEGVPKDIIFTLLISRIEVFEKGHLLIFTNSGTNANTFAKFKQELRTLEQAGLTMESHDSPKQYGPPIPAAAAVTLDGISRIKAQGLELVAGPKKNAATTATAFTVQEKNVDYRFCFDSYAANPRLFDAIVSDPRPVPGAEPSPVCHNGRHDSDDTTRTQRHGAVATVPLPSGSDRHLKLHIRSVENVIYYLGEIVRDELQNRNAPSPYLVDMYPTALRSEPATLFALAQNDDRTSDVLSVSYDGNRYGIAPGSNTDRSSEVLDIVEQLIALNNSAKDLPAPNVISVIGR